MCFKILLHVADNKFWLKKCCKTKLFCYGKRWHIFKWFIKNIFLLQSHEKMPRVSKALLPWRSSPLKDKVFLKYNKGILRIMYSWKVQQIYKRTPMSNCIFSKHLFLRTPLKGYFYPCNTNYFQSLLLPAFFMKISWLN